ncbi:MAG: S8 family serine peptidase [Gammaproteobacteria bacterium]|nr:S8 family serine peptidase [Gammaproteobacteria bacterium]
MKYISHSIVSSAHRHLAQALFVAAAIIFSTLSGSASAAPPEQKRGKWAEGRILVKGVPGLSDKRMAQILERQGGASEAKIRGVDVHMVRVPAHAEERMVAALARNPHVQFAELDMLVPPGEFIPADPRYKDQWHLPKMGTPSAWNSVSGDGITIAILDTGVDPNHFDLANKLLPGYNAADGGSDWFDIHGHGTAVAGVAGAIANNDAGVASVAWGATLLPIRVTNRSDGYAYFSDIARGLTWAADQGARVANISYGATPSYAISSAARYMKSKGGLVVVSAGNSGTDPGFGDNPDLISVSATNSTDAITSWSSYGNYIDVAAPGASIVTTKMNNAIGSWNGTSFSSPATAGVVALIISANPHLTPSEVESILESSALDLGASGWDNKFGHGRVDAAAAVQLALATASPSVDDTAPSVGFSLAKDSLVADMVTISVNATDDTEVSAVELFVNGQLLGTDTTAPYQFSWDTTDHPNGTITLEAHAHDTAGNTATATLTVVVDNQDTQVNQDPNADTEAPAVWFLTPSDGDTVSGGVSIKINASDNVGVTKLSCYANGSQLSTRSDATRLSCYWSRWDTRKLPDGLYNIEAHGEDAAGNKTVQTISVRLGS